MSRSTRAAARRPAGGSRRLAILLLILPLAGGLTAGTAFAEPPPTVQRLSAAEAATTGAAVALRHSGAGVSAVLEIVPAQAGALRLLAAAPDGSRVALTGAPVEGEGWLRIANADGSQVHIALPGVSGAAFSPAGELLVAIDATGVLWQVDAVSGSARRLADGPFGGTPLLAADGSIIVLSVSSVEAPYRSRAVRLDPAGGAPQPISDDELVYAVSELGDGSLILLAHEPGGNRLKRAAGGAVSLLADLGRGAIAAAIAADGSLIAFQRGQDGVFTTTGRGPARRVGDGEAPVLSRDGRWLLVRRGDATDLLDLDAGRVTATYDGAAVFIDCTEECLP